MRAGECDGFLRLADGLGFDEIAAGPPILNVVSGARGMFSQSSIDAVSIVHTGGGEDWVTAVQCRNQRG